MKHIQTFKSFINENLSTNIVLDEGNGILINKVWKMWTNIKTQKDWNNWASFVKSVKFGTYGTISFLESLEKFKPNFPNETLKRDFIQEIKQALEKI